MTARFVLEYEKLKHSHGVLHEDKINYDNMEGNMKIKHKRIDINSHITDIKCNIAVDNGIPKASVSFNNLGYGTITAVKFNARGYNSFGDIVYVNGSNSLLWFCRILQ